MADLYDKIQSKAVFGSLNMRPLIIVSPSINGTEDEIKLSRAYCKAVYSAGGIAFASDYGNAMDIAERVMRLTQRDMGRFQGQGMRLSSSF